MKRFLPSIIIFAVVLVIYYLVGTNYTLKPKWALDYFNQIAQSILNFHLDIASPGTTYDLSFYDGKWYAPWGILPALILIPLQFIKGQFIPTFYLSIFFSSLNVVLMYWLLLRVKKEFLPRLSTIGICICLIFLAFGTTQFYVGTLGSVWHVDQITTSFLGTLGIFIIFRKKRKFRHYFLSVFCFGLTLLGRPTMVLLVFLPITLYFFDLQKRKVLTTLHKLKSIFTKEIIFLSMPLIFFVIIFSLYNYIRFNNIFEYGFNHIHESPYLEKLREQNGPFSIKNMPRNISYMIFHLPGIDLANRNIFNFNLNGNSIFFLSPPLLAIFLASPMEKKKRKFILNSYIFPLWITAIITLIPSLMHYASGWVQLGYRYSLDVNIFLVLLSIFGVKGNVGIFYTLGTIFAVVIYTLGIRAFM